MAKRVLTLCVVAALASIALLAAPPSSRSGIVKGRSGYQPLEANQRLFYPLKGLDFGTLEVHFLVGGSPYLTEVVDLSHVVVPKVSSECTDKLNLAAPLTFRLPGDDKADGIRQPRFEAEYLKGARVLELLAREPDEVRELHRLAGEGTPIAVEILHSGKRVESIPFAELVRRSGELRGGAFVPVTALSEVRVTTSRLRKPVLSISKNDYLPDCNQCTWDTSCDTECGYDPGKGGPVTCGEWGVCSGTCQPSWVASEHWSDWYNTSSGVVYYAICLNNIQYNRFWAYQRRDYIRETEYCPNSPSCTGCYYVDTVIDYQTRYVYCLSSSGAGCFSSELPCCAELCGAGDACSFSGPCHE
jgi:hypothetical protein